jgi:hypothetical protein
MADEQNNLSAASAPSDAAPAPSPSEPAAAESENPSWWQRLRLGRRAESAPTSEAGTEATNGDASSQTLSLSQEDLERRIQAETDRREARRQQAAAAEARRHLRDNDPYAYVEQEREAEQQVAQSQQFNQLLGTVGLHHDRAVMDPIVMSLDDKERDRIMGLPGAGVGLDGRKLVITETLKSLEKRWKAEGAAQAERKLRSNPAFRKQVFAEQRGQVVEPDLMPSSGSVGGDVDVSGLLRRAIGR